jgi:thiamine-phosphate pyrophosphorylase
MQYRNKVGSLRTAYAEARLLREKAAHAGVTFLVNDRCDLAMAIDADGVHLGQHDLPVSYARKLLGPDKLVGLSTHNESQVRAAADLPIDYLAFGPVFPPRSKTDHDPVVGLSALADARPLTTRPLFAIGGIARDEVRAVIQAGADGIAVISAVLSAPDVGRAVRELQDRLAELPSPAP